MQNSNKVIYTQSALNPKHETRNSKQYQITKCHKQESIGILHFENSNLFRISIFEFRISRLGTLSGPGDAGLGSFSDCKGSDPVCAPNTHDI